MFLDKKRSKISLLSFLTFTCAVFFKFRNVILSLKFKNLMHEI